VIDAGNGPLIYDFCPRGCFAADTEILSRVGGRRTYSQASQITPENTLWSMSDKAGLGAVALTRQHRRQIRPRQRDAQDPLPPLTAQS
jgi:hypothetical protein